MRYLSDFVQGHFGVPAPATITIDLSNSLVDPLLADAHERHLLSYKAAASEAVALGGALGSGRAVA